MAKVSHVDATALREVEGRFWSRMERGDGCWLWKGSRMTKGYGKFKASGVQVSTHRAAWMLTHGEIPAGLYVCHRCDNPPCCNPAHLFLGTNADNQRDAMSKGRHRFGTTSSPGLANPAAKLTPDAARCILARRRDGATLKQVGLEFEISARQVGEVLNGTHWTTRPGGPLHC